MKTNPLLALTLGFLASFNSIAAAAPDANLDPAKLADVPKRMSDLVASHEVAGVVTLVATRTGVAQLEAVGKSNLETNTPMKPDAIFWIASMTKPITATSILILQDEGKLSV